MARSTPGLRIDRFPQNKVKRRRRLRIEVEKGSPWTMSGISAGRSPLSRPRGARQQVRGPLRLSRRARDGSSPTSSCTWAGCTGLWHALSASGCNSRQGEVTGHGWDWRRSGGASFLPAARRSGPRCRPVCLAGSMPARRTWRSASGRPSQPSRCGPGPRTTVSASGNGCRRSRRLSTGGMPRTR